MGRPLRPRQPVGSGLNTVHLRPVRPELVEGPCYEAGLRQTQPERVKLVK